MLRRSVRSFETEAYAKDARTASRAGRANNEREGASMKNREADSHNPVRNSVKTERGEEIKTGIRNEERRIGRKGPPFDLIRAALKPKAIISMFAVLILLTASLSMLTDGQEGGGGTRP